jgi:hypothetical protein
MPTTSREAISFEQLIFGEPDMPKLILWWIVTLTFLLRRTTVSVQRAGQSRHSADDRSHVQARLSIPIAAEQTG